MENVLVLLCNLLSCYIVISVLYQFMESRYTRTYNNRYLYIVIQWISILIFTMVNMKNYAVLNLSVWIVIAGVSAYFLYYEDSEKQRRIVECEAFALLITVCETAGAILLQWVLQMFRVEIADSVILYCLEVAFSKIVVIFMYFIIANYFISWNRIPISQNQYIVYIVMLAYSLVNLFLIVGEFTQGETNYLWAANMGCIVLADLYLLHFIKISGDKNYYESQVKALEQQAEFQYGYYLSQTEKYNSTLQILHDVGNHIKAIEGLYETGQMETAAEYTKEINEMLRPLVPTRYTGNPILDILLTDKAMSMKEKKIEFVVKIDNVDLQGIEPIDVTTIFGNLIDNAIEAAETVDGYKYLSLQIHSYHKMVSVLLENSSKPVKWKNGNPVSEKGDNRGLGILNVKRSISKYDGDISFRWQDAVFTVEMFLNL